MLIRLRQRAARLFHILNTVLDAVEGYREAVESVLMCA
jgi:hypothetical protein